jgi:hypothetical protein
MALADGSLQASTWSAIPGPAEAAGQVFRAAAAADADPRMRPRWGSRNRSIGEPE